MSTAAPAPNPTSATARQCQAVAAKLSASQPFVGFDPTIILSVVTLFVNFLKQCHTPAAGHTVQSELAEEWNDNGGHYGAFTLISSRFQARRALRQENIPPTKARINALAAHVLDQGRVGDQAEVAACWTEAT